MTDKPRSDHSDRTKAERIERLRTRLAELGRTQASPGLIGVLRGILDLLADEL